MTGPLFFFLALLVLFINIIKRIGNNESVFIWLVLFIIFLYALLDKFFRVHVMLSRYFSGVISINHIIFINIVYVILFVAVMAFFYRFFINQYRENPDWLYLFAFALLLKVISISSDLIFHDITEDYFEVFSLYFFTSSFLLAFLNRETIKNRHTHFIKKE